MDPHLSYPPDVLVPVLLRKAQVLVQSESHIVTVEAIGGETEMEQVLLKRSGNGRLSRCTEAGKPYRETLLLAQLEALSA